jgi:tetratricopeptide (TPR) repeat protein
MRPLLVIALLFSIPVHAQDGRLLALIQKGDAEEKQGHTRLALTHFHAAEQIAPADATVILRISKQYSDLVDITKPPADAENYAWTSLSYAQRGLDLDPRSAKAHLGLAVAYGKLTDFVGNKTKLEYSKIIKAETEKSIELDPTDAFAWHLLGRWHAGVAGVGGVLKVMAKLVYGGMPPASNEEAVRCLKKATELAPKCVLHHGALARVYKAMGSTDLANKEWQAVVSLVATDAEEEKDQRDARAALGLPQAAPLPPVAAKP